MATLTLVQVISDALRPAMRRNPNIVILGEDVGKVGNIIYYRYALA